MLDHADKFVTPITEKETIEFFSEGLKQAASAAKDLAVEQNHPIWGQIALACSELRLYGIQLANGKYIGRQKALQILDLREKKMSDNLEKSRPQKLIVS